MLKVRCRTYQAERIADCVAMKREKLMPNTAKSSRIQFFKHLVTVGALLMPVGAVQAQNCGCEASRSNHHHHHKCCPPGLLDRLNDLSDAVESSIKSLVPIRNKDCDGCGCDSCDHSSTQSHAANQPHQHKHSHPTSTRDTSEFPKPTIDSEPFHSTPQRSNPDSPRIPDWLSDPFKDETQNDRPTKVRSASMQTDAEEEESILLFDPQASHRQPSVIEQLFKMVSKKQVRAVGTSSHVVASSHTVRCPSPSSSSKMIVREIILRHVTDNQLVKADTKVANAKDETPVNDAATIAHDDSAESEVVQASAFVPVYVAPIPRRN
jgi:hypothetical protein